MPSLTTYTLLKQEHNARRGEFKTVHEENAKWRYNSYKRLSKENWGAEVAE